MRDPVSRRATRYGVVLGLVNGATQFGYAIAAYSPGAPAAYHGGAFVLVALLVLTWAATIVSVVLLLQLGYAIGRQGSGIARGVGAGIQAGFLAGVVIALGGVLGEFVALAMRHSNVLTSLSDAAVFTAGSLVGILLLALLGAGLGAGLAAVGAALGQRRYRRDNATESLLKT
jgi:hypothetical protein